MRFEMEHSATRTSDGLVHVQNYVAGMKGQHHVHTRQGFQNWLKNIVPQSHPIIGSGTCPCGLGIADVREFDGKVWHNEHFTE